MSRAIKPTSVGPLVNPRAAKALAGALRRTTLRLATSAAPWAFALIPAVLLATLVIWWLGDTEPFEPAYALLIPHVLFMAPVALLVARLAATSFARGGALSVLLLGAGMLAFGLAAGISAVAVQLGALNLALTVHNVGTCLAAVLHLGGALAAWRPGPTLAAPRVCLYVVYLLVTALIAFLAVAAIEDLIPPFYEADTPSTPLRLWVLSIAVVLMTLAAAILARVSRREKAPFITWYTAGLGMVAVGLLALVLQSDVGTGLGWLGRASQWVGGLYVLLAVYLAVRQSGSFDAALQSALQRSEQRFRTLVDSMPHFVWEADARGRTVYVSRQWERYTGLSLSQSAGQGWAQAFHPEDLPRQRAAWTQAQREGSPFELEVRVRQGDSQDYRWHVVRGAPCVDRHGELTGWVGTYTDVHDHRRAERGLRESEKKLRVALDSAGMGTWVYNLADNICRFDERAQELYNVGEAEYLHDEPGVTRLVHPDDVARMWEAVARASDPACGRYKVEYRIPLPNGENRWLSVWGLMEFETRDGKQHPVRLIGASRDITEQTLTERALERHRENLEQRVMERTAELNLRATQLARLSSELTIVEQRERRRLAQVLHDHLQQLLVGAKYGMELLSHRSDGTLQESVAHVNNLIDEAIKASRSMTVELSPPILHEAGLGAGLEWLARWKEQRHGIHVHFTGDQNVDAEREDVRVLVFQAVRELLFNAVKHANVEEAFVELAAADDGYLRVVVRDNGRGFEPEKVRLTAQGSMEGGGFGLFSIRERLALLGGSLTIESKPGEGACFTIIAPAKASGPRPADEVEKNLEKVACLPPSPPPKSAWSPLRDTGERTRVLLVDDHEVLRQGLVSLLSEEKDLEVVGEARDGLEALAQARAVAPDVVLMDFSMPRMDGIEATRRLRREMPQVRVIGLSMYEEPDRSSAMLDAGATAYLTKSGKSAKLLEAIRQAHRPTATSA